VKPNAFSRKSAPKPPFSRKRNRYSLKKGTGKKKREIDRHKRIGAEKWKAFSQKACSEAAIPSVATSIQKESDGIGSIVVEEGGDEEEEGRKRK
jgi:hypothetical protein